MKPKIYSEPSLHHIQSKLVAYMLCCVLIGLLLGIAFPTFSDDDKINRIRRSNTPARVFRPIRTLRTSRRKAA